MSIGFGLDEGRGSERRGTVVRLGRGPRSLCRTRLGCDCYRCAVCGIHPRSENRRFSPLTKALGCATIRSSVFSKCAAFRVSRGSTLKTASHSRASASPSRSLCDLLR